MTAAAAKYCNGINYDDVAPPTLDLLELLVAKGEEREHDICTCEYDESKARCCLCIGMRRSG